MMAGASHSPLLYFPARETEGLQGARAGLATVRAQLEAFDPQLVVLFGCDHYGGQQMFSMPAFCIGVEARALSDVGGTPGSLNVPRALAVDAVNAVRARDVDVAVSYDMEVDHGFSQALQELTGGIDRYPVLPIFLCCLQPPFVPFKRARALGQAVAEFVLGLDLERIAVLSTGGLSHDPSILFPPIDHAPDEWRPYILNGNRQNQVPQQAWIDYEIAMHKQAAGIIANDAIPLQALSIHEEWDRMVMDILANGDLSQFDGWTPEAVAKERGIGSVEIATWIAGTQMIEATTGTRPAKIFHQGVREVGIGFAVMASQPAPARTRDVA